MTERKPGANAIAFILITVLLDTIGFTIVIPVMPQLLVELTGRDVGDAAAFNGYLMVLFATAQLFFAPIFGNLSDRFGRRPVLLLSLTAFGIDYVVMGFAPTFTWLIISRALAGVFGATFAPANAYVADITTPEKRAQNFGLIGAAWGVGFMLGPAIGGLLGQFGPRVPFFAAAGLAMLNVIYGFFVLPESLPRENRRAFDWKRANPVGALMQIRQYPALLGLFGVILLYQIAHDVNPTIWSFFLTERFEWSTFEIGVSLMLYGALSIFVQAVLIRAIISPLGDAATAYLGLFLFGLGFLGIALATHSWMVYAAIVPMCMGGLARPAIQGILSNRVPNNAQGELQAALTCIMSLTTIGTPILMPQLFAYFTGSAAPMYYPGAPFALAAAITGMSIGLFAVVHRPVPQAPG